MLSEQTLRNVWDFLFNRNGFVGGKLLPQLKKFIRRSFAAINFIFV